MITLRLDPLLERSVKTAAEQLGISKSELIRESIAEYIAKLDKPSAWELGGDVFGKHASGSGDLSRNRKSLIKNKIKQK